MSASETVVQQQLDAYNAHDLEAFVATYADDVAIYEHPDQLLVSGRAALRERYRRRFDEAPELHASITARIVQGEYIIDHEHVTGNPGGEERRVVVIYRVKEERISTVWFLR